MNLQTPHPKLPDGIIGGFRSPDAGWTGTTNAEEVNWDALTAGDLVFSAFWIGPTQDANAFAEKLVADLEAWLANPPDCVDPPALAVGLWHSPGTGLSLVMYASLTYDLVISEESDEEWLEEAGLTSLLNLPESLTMVAGGDDDNSYDSLLETLEEQSPEEPTLALLAEVAQSDGECDDT